MIKPSLVYYLVGTESEEYQCINLVGDDGQCFYEWSVDGRSGCMGRTVTYKLDIYDYKTRKIQKISRQQAQAIVLNKGMEFYAEELILTNWSLHHRPANLVQHYRP